MPKVQVYDIYGINTYVNPLVRRSGDLLQGLNVDSTPYLGKSSRGGYTTFLDTPDSSQINNLFSFNIGTQLFLYRVSGSAIYYSLQGTGSWTLAGNGTITNGGHVGYAVLDNTLILGDGVGSTRHTTNGTSFTNTTLAPIGEFFEQYQRRIYIGGTASTLFYSTSNDATNWNTSGTSDSSSFTIPGSGKINGVPKVADRLHINKTSKNIFKWDGYSLIDTATTTGPSSPYSIAKCEGYAFWINQDGHYGYDGGKPNLLSNAVQNLFYNNVGSGIAGSIFGSAPAGVNLYDYYTTIGTVTDDSTGITINDAVLKYNFKTNEYLLYKYYNKPTAFHSYIDTSGSRQFIFGDANGQVYRIDPTLNSDNGQPIESVIEFMVSDRPDEQKQWRWLHLSFNPGCMAVVSIATVDTFTNNDKNYVTVGQGIQGIFDYRFPANSRGNLLFVKISHNSTTSKFYFYGGTFEYDIIPQ